MLIYRRFGTTYPSYFQGQAVREEIQNFQIHGTETRLVCLLNTFLVAVLSVLSRDNSALLYNV
jgi:hypothetical protein